MSQPPEEANAQISSELESFRQQWREEVRARAAPGKRGNKAAPRPRPNESAADASSVGLSIGPSAGPSGGPGHPWLPVAKAPAPVYDAEDDFVRPLAFDEPLPPVKSRESADGAAMSEGQPGPKEPVSALEHFEKAVEREEVGSLGESLRLYRKAFRMDSAVDKKYKNKHFPAPAAPASGATGKQASAPAPAPVPARTGGKQMPMDDLVASFAGLAMEAAPPPIEGMPPPPCPLAWLPDEILVHIMGDVAVQDVADFVRLGRVCKKLAYLVANEDQIWRRVCVESAVGFGAMRRAWQTTIAWAPLHGRPGELGEGGEEGEVVGDDSDDHDDMDAQAHAETATTLALRAVYPSWQHMFRARPRIRFNGCYISTVNYIRPGQASANHVTWNSPVHIVTYFRYLRFFRDGTVVSLLTTAEPVEVVYYLTRELAALHRDGAMAHLPSIVMQWALRGRWRMAAIGDGTVPCTMSDAVAAESDLVVETEGVGKYYNRMDLTLQTGGKGTRNNKLNWRGFYSYNRLTDDWGEFGLKNDRPFFFSRVKSYGQ